MSDAPSVTAPIHDYLHDPTEGLSAEELAHRLEPMVLGKSGPLIKQSYEAALDQQHLRELVKNSIEAKIPDTDLAITIHPDWNFAAETAAQGEPVFRLMVEDNGSGMNGQEMSRFFRSLSLSGEHKRMGIQDNFGMGAKISTMPGNPYGVLVMSWQGGEGNMVRMYQDRDGEYGLWRWDVGNDKLAVAIEPPDAYTSNGGGLPRHHGTAVICMGHKPDDDTYLHFPDQPNPGLKGTAVFLNRRFFRFPDGVTVRAFEFVKKDKDTWLPYPGKFKVAVDKKGTDVYKGGNYREVHGQKHYLDTYCTDKGSVRVSGATIHWWVIDDDRRLKKAKEMHGAGFDPGFTGALYQDEIYNWDRSPGRFRQFGIFYAEARKRISLLVEPDYTEDSGVFPDGSRRTLLCMDTKDKRLPWGGWGTQFMAKMPAAIKKVCDQQAADMSSLDDVKKSIRKQASYLRERLQNRKTVEGGTTPKDRDPTNPPKPRRRTKNTTGKKHGRTMPDIEFVQDKNSANRDRPAEYHESGTLLIFLDHALFQDEIRYWCEQFEHLPDPALVEDKVTNIVAHVYAWNLVAKVVHATYFKNHKLWKDDAYKALLSPEALTMALLGKVDAETQIRAKLTGTLGATKKSTPASA